MDNPLRNLDWTLVQSFLSVAEEGSLSAAARKLGRSQPTLGRQIRALEQGLQADLFHRQPRGLRLTDTGAALVPPARAMRAALHSIALAAAGQQAELAGTVRITASEMLSHHVLPAIVARLRRSHPEIEIEIVPTDRTSNLLYREADIALRMFRPDQLDLVTRHLGDIPLGLFAAQSYVARRGVPIRAEDLINHDIIGYDRDPAIIDGMAAAGLPQPRDFFRLRCDDNVVYWELVRAGCGIGFALRPLGRADPDMVEIDIGQPLPRLEVWLTAHEAMRRTPRIRRVWDALAKGLGPVFLDPTGATG